MNLYVNTLAENLGDQPADLIDAQTCPNWADIPRASVSILLVADRVLFIERAIRPGDRWSGQMAFPGGRRHREDVSDMHTAERETMEECGLDLSRHAVLLGQLNDRPVYHWFSRKVMMIISTFVYKWTEDTAGTPAFLLDRREVAAVYLVPIHYMLDFMRDTQLLREQNISYPIFKRVQWLTETWKLVLSWVLGDIHFPTLPIPIEYKITDITHSSATARTDPNPCVWGLTLGICSDLLDLVLRPEQASTFMSINTAGVWFDAWDVNCVLKLLDRQRNSVGRRSNARYNWGLGAAAVITSSLAIRIIFIRQMVKIVRSKL